MILIAPLRIVRPRSKDWLINLNTYRNSHYMTLNGVKIKYKALMQDQIDLLPKLNRVQLKLVLFPKTRRRMDLTNMLSIQDKFICDALVLSGKLEDDDYLHIVETTYSFGEVDKENPRTEIHITEI